MRRGATKKSPVERRKKPRGKSSAASKSVSAATKTAREGSRRVTSVNPAAGTQAEPRKGKQDHCYHCAKNLSGSERALFVEEEVGRVFCSEECITGYFAPEIERLEKEYMRRLVPGDLSGDERESLAHLRFITLQEPDEVWREKTLTGDYRYALISEFQPGARRIWCVCICLFLRGEPSFLYIAFTTQNAAMAHSYRRGERVEWVKKPASKKSARRTVDDDAQGEETALEGDEARGQASDLGDRLADAWTEDETFLAQVGQERSADDIPSSEFELYQGCLEETLEAPDEVWSVEMSDGEGRHLYHFIRHYGEESPGHWYVILARETEDEEQIEILDAFPTRDSALVERYRRGTQEVGELPDQRPASRLVH